MIHLPPPLCQPQLYSRGKHGQDLIKLLTYDSWVGLRVKRVHTQQPASPTNEAATVGCACSYPSEAERKLRDARAEVPTTALAEGRMSATYPALRVLASLVSSRAMGGDVILAPINGLHLAHPPPSHDLCADGDVQFPTFSSCLGDARTTFLSFCRARSCNIIQLLFCFPKIKRRLRGVCVESVLGEGRGRKRRTWPCNNAEHNVNMFETTK